MNLTTTPLLFLVLFIFTFSSVSAQNSSLTKRGKRFPYRKANKFSLEDIEKKPDNYRDSLLFLEPSWLSGKVLLSSTEDTVEMENIRYDLAWHRLECLYVYKDSVAEDTVNIDSLYEIHDLYDVSYFSLEKEGDEEEEIKPSVDCYVNANAYHINKVPLVGFFKIVLDGEYKVLSRTVLKKVKPYIDYEEANELRDKYNYTPNYRKLEIPIRTNVKEEQFYFATPDNEVQLMDYKKKNALLFFDKYAELVELHSKKHRYSLRRLDGLIKATAYVNELLEKQKEI